MKKILVVDDEEILTKTFSKMLEKQGFEVLIALRVEDALAMAEEEDFDLILCDIRMPGQNGVATAMQIQELRGQAGKKQIPIIFLTGYADEDLQMQAQELKPLAYLFKPFDTFKLIDLIKRELS
jgi:CheY-like chemotaxis protein